MTAAACMQILIGNGRIAPSSEILSTVAKVTNAFLEGRWSWPKRYLEINAVSFMLTDPAARALNSKEVQALSAELQMRLFGKGEHGDVELALFEGSADDARKFAQLNVEDLRLILNAENQESLGLHGRILRVKGDRIEVAKNMQDEGDLEIWDDALEALDAQNVKLRIIFRGIYLTPKQQFVGSIASRWSSKDRELQSILNGPAYYPRDHENFDRETIDALVAEYPDSNDVPAMIHLPVSYTNLTRRNARARYHEFFQPLLNWRRELLVAELYDAPRALNHVALLEAKQFLAPYFGALDLLIADPETDFKALESGIARSATLALSNDDEAMRDAAIRRFMSQKQLFRAKHIWPMVANLRSRHEMQVCNSAGALFLHGPAVSNILEKPVAMANYLLSGLPLTAQPAVQSTPAYSAPAPEMAEEAAI